MKTALTGYGKMGHMTEQTALECDHEIVSTIDVDNTEDLDSPAPVPADIATEFTNPTAAFANYQRTSVYNVKAVGGSTDWMQDRRAEVECMYTGGRQALLWVSNSPIGAAISSVVNRYLAKIVNGFPQYNVEVGEVYHVHKLDVPSGTAIALTGKIIKDLDRKDEWVGGF